MKILINFLIKIFGKHISNIIIALCNAVCSFFKYKSKILDQKITKEKTEKIEKLNKKIDEVTKNGSLEDLLNLRK